MIIENMEPLKKALGILHGCANRLTQSIAFFENSQVTLTEQQNDDTMNSIDALEGCIKTSSEAVSDVIKDTSPIVE